MPRLLVLPADPIDAYVRKGEIKTRYFNPEDVFDEIHIAATDERPAAPSVLGDLGGRARVEHHALGRWRVLSARRSPYVGPYVDALTALARRIRPDVIRAYTPVEVGWLAREASRATGAPYVVSVHGNWDLDYRERLRVRGRWKGYLYFTLTRAFVERPVLRGAARVICVYEFAARYARALRAGPVDLIYNRVYLERFRPVPREGPFTTLFVGRCEENKGQDLLIHAMPDAPGDLILVGDGPTRPALEALARDVGVAGRVTFIPSVPHDRIPEVYARANCYASAILYGGIQIPHLEAMASGLPIVIAQPLWEREPEQMGDVALTVERTPAAMAAGIARVAVDRTFADERARRSLSRARALDGPSMERRERVLYDEVLALGSHNS